MSQAFCDLPFTLPDRPAVRRIRQVAAPPVDAVRTQSLTGFEPRFTDIVDYIVRITDEIWQDRAVGYIRDTYDPASVIYSSYGVVRTAEKVVQSTLAGIAAVPDGDTNHIAVAWAGDDRNGFYTAHIGFGHATNTAPSLWGPATGKSYIMRFAADCLSRANMIHTEWLVRDAGAQVRHLGFDLDDAARAVAAIPQIEPYLVAGPVVGTGRVGETAPSGTPAGWACELFETVWNGRRFDRLKQFYAADATVHSGGGRTMQGLPAISTLLVQLLASIPDGVLRVEHVCWSEETDGVIVAARWVLAGSSARGGLLGNQWPAGRPVFMMGASHFRLTGALIIEEWTVFDEVAVLAMAYRA